MKLQSAKNGGGCRSRSGGSGVLGTTRCEVVKLGIMHYRGREWDVGEVDGVGCGGSRMGAGNLTYLNSLLLYTYVTSKLADISIFPQRPLVSILTISGPILPSDKAFSCSV